jgi:hypothetical protein
LTSTWVLAEPDRQAALQLGYIAGADVPAPAVALLNGVIASLAVTEFMAFARTHLKKREL